MTCKQKALYVFLIIITFGLILIWWNKKYKKTKVSTELSTNTKLPFKFEKLVELLGNKDNLESATSTNKVVKINFKDRKLIKAEDIAKLDGVSGITFQSKAISLVVGNCANQVEKLINSEVNDGK
ncbi:PTS system IIB component (Glc family) [Metamycoplasma subdolum]|uniref:PTS system IIB component (Glc family) n=1 Tax=Metamycoplasma subdolum TaxID=92407 RepID=A0A3M0A1W1_9BACT|nr:PTS glucose transporter subunit IIB [Metamycoplasma subdolum]RMA77419.1 PTS system IIB component (Glc family) [Metamycoplasma subdolum]WPB50404.1 PTS glucose transporter subunit IIB [Metamycoplasma subdolum]